MSGEGLSFSDAVVSVVVPTFRRPEILADTLHAVTTLDYPSDLLEVIVVDDAADAATARVVSACQGGRPVVQYHPQERQGAAAARNVGARVAAGRVLLFVDDDIVLRPDSVQRHLRTLAHYAPCAVAARWEFAPALIESLRGTPFGRYRIGLERWVKSRIDTRRLDGPYLEAEGISACNLAIAREDFWRVGGFSEAFPYAGAEDQEFSIRARAAGLRLIYDEGHEVWHNDHRLGIRQFCERQRRGAVSAVYLAASHSRSHAPRPLIVENLPIRSSDSHRVILKKLAKAALAVRPVTEMLFVLTGLLERLTPRAPWLPRLYWWLCGVAIFKGVREGAGRLVPDQRRALEAAAYRPGPH